MFIILTGNKKKMSWGFLIPQNTVNSDNHYCYNRESSGMRAHSSRKKKQNKTRILI